MKTKIKNSLSVNCGLLFVKCSVAFVLAFFSFFFTLSLSVYGAEKSNLAALNGSGTKTAQKVSVGAVHSCALLSNGTVKCWGANSFGQLGNGKNKGPETCTNVNGQSFACSTTPVFVSGITNAISISAGGSHTCVLLKNGTVKCWGGNNYGELGNGKETDSTTPVSVSGITTATSISAGNSHTCALLKNGSVKCWGWNVSGQLGNRTKKRPEKCTSSSPPFACSTTPVSVSGITNATNISAVDRHTCALLSDGTIKCWGSNSNGNLGNGKKKGPDCGGYCYFTPVFVSGIHNATSVSEGNGFLACTCALLSDKTVKCWGFNREGQLGNGQETDSATPVPVSGITNAISISAASMHTCGLLSDGTVKCWGYNYHGELGNGTETGSTTPVPVSGITNAISISAGGSHTCAVLSDGTVQCWGNNRSGELGNGTTTNSNVPVSVDNSLYTLLPLKFYYFAFADIAKNKLWF